MKRPMDIAYEYIRERILTGEFLPSQKLNESDLADEIGVSRNTIKKSLYKLEQEHLVEMEENKGAYVKSFTVNEIVNYFEIRAVLEALIIRGAVAQITDEELNELEEIWKQMEFHLTHGNYDAYSKLNKTFHQIIYDRSTNQIAVEMVEGIKLQLLRFHLRTVLVPGRINHSIKEHKEILEALKKRNPDRADQAIQEHIKNISKTIEGNFPFLM